jgi:geranylgeranyl diphosphate synthase, type I
MSADLRLNEVSTNCSTLTSAMSAAPPSLAAIGAQVEQCLAELLAFEEERWVRVEPELRAPLQSLAQLIQAGGKRLRPAFCYWGFIGAGGDPDDAGVVAAGAAFELLHGFALFHDDVMDGSATRRGARTAHLVYADRHTENAWLGEARRFGEGVAILVGDLAFVYADQLLADAPAAAWRIWNELRIELNIGQYLDIVGTAASERNRSGAERISRYKSGKYTVERPLHLGAALAAPDRVDELLPALSAYGLPLGDAFQLRDDMLGAFGKQEMTGKPVGDDLVEGKPTPLLAVATERATDAQRRILADVGRPGLGPDDVAAIQDVLVATGAYDELNSVIAALVGEAVDSLEKAPIELSAKSALTDLAYYVGSRES